MNDPKDQLSSHSDYYGGPQLTGPNIGNKND